MVNGRLIGITAPKPLSVYVVRIEVKELKAEARQLKETLAEVLIENRLLKKSGPTGGSADIPDHFLRAVRYALACLSHRGSPTGLR